MKARFLVLQLLISPFPRLLRNTLYQSTLVESPLLMCAVLCRLAVVRSNIVCCAVTYCAVVVRSDTVPYKWRGARLKSLIRGL